MDFFALQDKARTQTRVLVVLFAAAVLLIILAVNLLIYAAYGYQMTAQVWFFDEPYALIITLVTVAIILFTSIRRTLQLKSSPDAIAKMVNATAVNLSTKDNQQQRLINVVEEMSIASGVSMPKIFIMKEEQGINAFVAGLEPSNTILVVTQGLLESLNRQELQAVIAHEYSHIFHGDMRINVKLIGILAGILVIGQLGHSSLRSIFYTNRNRHHHSSHFSSTSSKNKGSSSLTFVLGLGLLAIGYIGLFFGRLIKAAISRQREFLADASAVQYTRDKEGICGALFKISQHQNGALLNTGKAEEMSHLCFGESIKHGFFKMLATHPPIEARIKAVNPRYYRNLSYTRNKKSSDQQKSDQQTVPSDFSSFSSENSGITRSNQGINDVLNNNIAATDKKSQPSSSQAVINQIGAVSSLHIQAAHQLVQQLPGELLAIARGQQSEMTAGDLIIALLFSHTDTSIPQIKTIKKLNQIKRLSRSIGLLNYQQQHALLDIALARIEQREVDVNKDFVATLSRVVNHDKQVKLSEFMIYISAVKRALPSRKPARTLSSFKKIETEVIQFFSLLYLHSQIDSSDSQKQFDTQLKLLGIPPTPLSKEIFLPATLGKALSKISQLHPLLKKDFITLCVEIVNNDNNIDKNEYELLRILGEYLDAPLPVNLDSVTL